MVADFQCHFSSLGIERTKGKGRKTKSIDHNTDKSMLVK